MKFGQREMESVENGGDEKFVVRCVCRVYVSCVTYFSVIIFRNVLSLVY